MQDIFADLTALKLVIVALVVCEVAAVVAVVRARGELRGAVAGITPAALFFGFEGTVRAIRERGRQQRDERYRLAAATEAKEHAERVADEAREQAEHAAREARISAAGSVREQGARHDPMPTQDERAGSYTGHRDRNPPRNAESGTSSGSSSAPRRRG